MVGAGVPHAHAAASSCGACRLCGGGTHLGVCGGGGGEATRHAVQRRNGKARYCNVPALHPAARVMRLHCLNGCAACVCCALPGRLSGAAARAACQPAWAGYDACRRPTCWKLPPPMWHPARSRARVAATTSHGNAPSTCHPRPPSRFPRGNEVGQGRVSRMACMHGSRERVCGQVGRARPRERCCCHTPLRP